MKLELCRYHASPECTRGLLFVDDAFECHTLEPPDEAVPPGYYPLDFRTDTGMAQSYAKRFPSWHRSGIPELQDVPARTYIYLHIGNRPRETSGCILVGQHAHVEEPWVGFSVPAYHHLYERVARAARISEPISIRIYTYEPFRRPWWRRLWPFGSSR